MKQPNERRERHLSHLEWIRNTIRPKTFLKLAFGLYELTDGIYTYLMRKELSQDGEMVIYHIIEKDRTYSGRIFLFEQKENVYDESEDKHSDGYRRTILKAMSSVGGITVNGNIDIYNFKTIKPIKE